MFSQSEKSHLAAAIEAELLKLKHPEMPDDKPEFILLVVGKEKWSYAKIEPNWKFGPGNLPGVNPWNENIRDILNNKE